MFTSTTNRRPVLAVALLAATVVAVVIAIGAAATGIARTDAGIAELGRQIAALRRTDGAGPDPTVAGVLIEAATTGQGGAALQQRLTEIATANNVRLVSVQVLPVKRQGALAEVAVQASLNARTEGLRALVHAIETGLPLLVVDEVAIRTAPQSGTERGPRTGPTPLEATLRVRGFMAAGSSR